MARYRYKNYLVSAVQYQPGLVHPAVYVSDDTVPITYLQTPSGRTPLVPGDWIVASDQGTYWRYAPNMFEETYERAE